MNTLFFATPAEFRQWMEKNHDQSNEQWVGFYKRASGRPSITWPQSVDVALCFGWIDGIRKSIDEDSYRIRFTPRRPRSVWSAVNIKRANELIQLGVMHSAGLKAFEKRTENRSQIYSYEQRHQAKLSPKYERQFRRHKKAWDFFNQCPPGYKRTTIYWVISAKKEETRAKRLAKLISDSETGKSISELLRLSKVNRNAK